MAMPIMFGPGAIATEIGLLSTIKDSDRAILSFAVVALAICTTMLIITSLWLTPITFSKRLARKASTPRPVSSASSFRRWA
jgi:small neutral amino acid transporter SnatA (MarC family)